jgi:hypothetical protein
MKIKKPKLKDRKYKKKFAFLPVDVGDNNH